MADVDVVQVFRDAALSVTGKELGAATTESAFEDLGIDSVDSIEIVVEMERVLDLRFEDRDIASLRTLGDVAALVARLRSNVEHA